MQIIRHLGQNKTWKIHPKALRKGCRQFAKIWEALIFQGVCYQERGPRFQWPGNLYRKVNTTGLGLLSSESESCLVMSNSLRPYGLYSSWNSPDQTLEWIAFPFSRGSSQPRFQTPGLPHCRWILYQLSHEGNPRILEWVAYPISRGSFWFRNRTGVSCIAGKFFTNWAIREVCNFYNLT